MKTSYLLLPLGSGEFTLYKKKRREVTFLNALIGVTFAWIFAQIGVVIAIGIYWLITSGGKLSFVWATLLSLLFTIILFKGAYFTVDKKEQLNTWQKVNYDLIAVFDSYDSYLEMREDLRLSSEDVFIVRTNLVKPF
jgi:hypothetical protein